MATITASEKHSKLVVDQRIFPAKFSSYTRKNYTSEIIKFAKFCNVPTVESLLKQQDAKQRLMIYIDYMQEEKHLKPNSVSIAYQAIKFFYVENEIDDLPWKRIEKRLPEKFTSRSDKAYTKDDITAMLSNAQPRERVIVLLMASTGMRVGALATLQKGDLREVRLPDSDLCSYEITCYKGFKEEYLTFCTPEAKEALDIYFTYREKYGEKLTVDSPVIRNEFNKTDPARAYRGRPVSERHIAQLLGDLAVDAQLRDVQHPTETDNELHSFSGRIRKQHMRSHSFRKFFKSQLRRAGIDSDLREMLVGHKSNTLMLSYERLDEGELLREYTKAISFLTIDPSKELQAKVKQLEAERDGEIATLKRYQLKYGEVLKNMMLKANIPMEQINNLIELDRGINSKYASRELLDAVVEREKNAGRGRQHQD